MSSSAQHPFSELEQSYAQYAVPAPVFENNEMFWVGTSLSVADVSLLLGEGELEEIIETPVCTEIPGTRHWVMGVASYKGGLLPIISGDQFFSGTVYNGRPREYCMVIRRPGFHFAITLSSIERDIKFPIAQRDMNQAVDPAFSEYCLGGFHYDGKFLAILDVDTLISDSGLANASVAESVTNEECNDE